MATQLDRVSTFEPSPGREISAHHLWVRMLGALGVFWIAVGVSLWAIFS